MAINYNHQSLLLTELQASASRIITTELRHHGMIRGVIKRIVTQLCAVQCSFVAWQRYLHASSVSRLFAPERG